MSMQGNVGSEAAARDARNYIEGGKLEAALKRSLTESDREVLALVVAYLKSIEECSIRGWY